MAVKNRLTAFLETQLIADHPDAPMCSLDSMSALTGESRDWLIRQWRAGNLHAYQWGFNPDCDLRGQKIELQTHPDSAMACKVMMSNQRLESWRANAAVNRPKPIIASAMSPAALTIDPGVAATVGNDEDYLEWTTKP